MIFQVRFLVFIVAGVFISNLPFIQLQLEFATCNDFTIDTCHIDDGAIIETVKDVSEADCQFFCHTIYFANCTFFIFDKKQRLCEIISEPFGSYVDSCKKYAGPVTPNITECYESNEECKVSKCVVINLFRRIKLVTNCYHNYYLILRFNVFTSLGLYRRLLSL